jgi:hypothetical protein
MSPRRPDAFAWVGPNNNFGPATIAGVRHTPDHAAEESPVPLPIPPQTSIAPQSRLKRLCSR